MYLSHNVHIKVCCLLLIEQPIALNPLIEEELFTAAWIVNRLAGVSPGLECAVFNPQLVIILLVVHATGATQS